MKKKKEDRLIRHIKATYQSRYVANSRLLHIARLQNITSITNSVLVTFASILVLAPIHCFVDKKESLSYILVALSVLSLVLSIVLSNKNNQLLASDFHRCARELQSLHDKLISMEAIDLEYGYSEYDRILDSYNINHDPLDYEFKKNEEKPTWKSFLFRIRYNLHFFFIYYILLVGPIVLGILLFKYL